MGPENSVVGGWATHVALIHWRAPPLLFSNSHSEGNQQAQPDPWYSFSFSLWGEKKKRYHGLVRINGRLTSSILVCSEQCFVAAATWLRSRLSVPWKDWRMLPIHSPLPDVSFITEPLHRQISLSGASSLLHYLLAVLCSLTSFSPFLF